jgi:signal transduction histidine kinase/DNA-binding NarL/FixJ family response regulator
MSPLLIQLIAGISVIVSIVMLITIMANWGQPNMEYLGVLAVLIAIDAIGYYLEITAETLEAAMVAYKIQYASGNYIGSTLTLLAFAYSGWPIRKWSVRIALYIIPLSITLLVFVDPSRYIKDITFAPIGNVMRLSFKPTVFYVINFLYSFVYTLFSNAFTIRLFIRTNRRGNIHSVIYVGTVLLPIFCKILWWLGFFPEFDFFYVAIICMLVVLYLYLMRCRQLEWANLGREAILEHLTDAVMVVNADRHIINTNSIFFRFFPGFSCTRGQTNLTDFLDYLKVHTTAQLPSYLFDLTTPAPPNRVEFTIIPDLENSENRRNYTLTWQTVYAKKIPLGQAIIISDVTTYHTMIGEIIKLKQRAEEASKAKSEFLATVSHEIRTPLNAIIGLTEIQLQKDNLPQEVRTDMEKVYASGSELLNIINDILDISKIETGNLELIPALYSVPSLISDTVQLNVIRIGSKLIDFKLDIDETIPLYLWGDEKRVRQILNNLLSNAFKYTQEGTVSLRIQWTPAGMEGTMTFVVQDTGQGIKEGDLGKLFSQYGQLNTRANRNIEGTGLGLSITKKLAELMDGTIEVKSVFGKGSAFTVTIHQKLNNPAPIGKKIADGLRKFHFAEYRLEREKQRFRKQYPDGRILVVDDVETNLYVARGLLQPYGLRVDCVKNGQEAIAAIFSGTLYNIIFMDHMMPGMDGIETVRIIRERRSEYIDSLPIIALTANAIVGMKEMFLENGFNDYLSKPIEWSKLDEILSRWMPGMPDKTALSTNAPLDSADSWIPSIEGVNTARGLTLTGDSPKRYREILALYCEDMAEQAAALSEIPRLENLQDFAVHFHSIKSASANIGAERLRNRAAELEAAAKRKDILFITQHLGAFVVDLRAMFARIQIALYP